MCLGTEMTASLEVRKELQGEIVAALQGAKFPIETSEDLLKAFPQGPGTTCQAGGIKLTAAEASRILKKGDFPFKSADQVANTIIKRAGL